MTDLTARRVVRRTAFRCQGRPILVELAEGGKLIRFRQQGLRTTHTATVEQCFWAAVANTAAAQKLARAQARRERKAARP